LGTPPPLFIFGVFLQLLDFRFLRLSLGKKCEAVVARVDQGFFGALVNGPL
jgi:hypothetical protein